MFSISGKIKDGGNAEDLEGAIIFVKEIKKGTTTNTYGYYNIAVPEGTYTLRISSIGLKTEDRTVVVDKNINLNIELQVISKETKEVIVNGESAREQVNKTQMGKIDLPIETIKQLPVLFGEVDILKTLQLLPGVQSGSEGTTGFYVRGGGPDQNLIILDEATIYNANHLFGLFSVFNGDAVRGVELYKGGYPAKFGGRLSSVVDVKMKEGDAKKYVVTGGIGLIASRLTIEGPIKKDTSSFMISARRTYFDYFTQAYNKTQENKSDYTPIPRYYFYDLNAKANYLLSKKDRLFLSGYFGRDVFGFQNGVFNFGFNWGNETGTLRWNHIFGDKLFLNTSAIFTDYQYTISSASNSLNFELGSKIQDWQIKQDYGTRYKASHNINFGWSATYHTFTVGRFQLNSTQGNINVQNTNQLFGSEGYVYVSDDWEINDKVRLNYGLHGSGFLAKGSTHGVLEPRSAIRYKINDQWSFKGSYTRMAQYVHLISNSGTSLPTDVWYPTTANVKPQVADQIAAGTTFLLFGEKISITDEIYYKWLSNQIDFKNAAQLFNNPNLETEFVYGKGWAYGNEVFIEKKEGKLTGWVGYTLAYTFREFTYDEGQAPQIVKPKYDIRNDIKVVLTYKLNKRWTFSGVWVYNSGTLTTLPTGYSVLQDLGSGSVKTTDIYTTRSNYRMPAYHRADLGIVYKMKPKWGESDWTFSIYNLYNRRNPFFLYTETLYNNHSGTGLGLPSGFKGKQVSLFPIIPSFTYNFKF